MPRFSLLTLLAIVSYIALACAAFYDTFSPGAVLSVYAFIGLLFSTAVDGACEPTTKHGVFSRAFFGCAIAYLVIFWMPGHLVFGNPWFFVPHFQFALFYSGNETSGGSPFTINVAQDIARQNVENLAALHFSAAFGVLGGAIAFWRRQTLERRAATSASSE